MSRVSVLFAGNIIIFILVWKYFSLIPAGFGHCNILTRTRQN